MTPWSKIQDTSLASHAYGRIIMNESNGCAYHNWGHVVDMYQYLADTNEPYDEALDWAVLFHDIVYDNKSEKELRSAEAFRDMAKRYAGCTPDIWERERVRQLILHTADHIVTDHKGASAIIRADLHGLANRLTAYLNFGKIMVESMKLYGIDEVEFAKNSEEYMEKMLDRVVANPAVESTSQRHHYSFYYEVYKGVKLTIKLAQLIQGKL